MIDIPANITSLLMFDPTEEWDDEKAYEGILSYELLEMRQKQFSEELVAMCYDFFFFKESN